MMENQFKIRHIVILEKNTSYKFDLNQNVSIKGLKKMIGAAANIGKNSFSIFHKGKEYTNYDESTLGDLFPDLELVEFNIFSSKEKVDEKGKNIKLKLGKHCEIHTIKYPYFYCYDCKKSICSLCLQSDKHIGHKKIEKYDYLQSSTNLVENIFSDMKVNTTSANAKLDEKSYLEMKKKIQYDYFTPLIESIYKIQTRQLELLDFFYQNEKVSCDNMGKNLILLKNHCAEGLDLLKNEISIEDMLFDEEIFLTFDRKFREIRREKNRIDEDDKKFAEIKNSLTSIMSVLEQEQQEIQIFLNKFSDDSIHDELKKKISKNSVANVSKEDIMKKMFNDVRLSKTAKSILKSPTTANIVSCFTPGNTEAVIKENRKIEETPQGGSQYTLFKNNQTDSKYWNKNGKMDVIMEEDPMTSSVVSVNKGITPQDRTIAPVIRNGVLESIFQTDEDKKKTIVGVEQDVISEEIVNNQIILMEEDKLQIIREKENPFDSSILIAKCIPNKKRVLIYDNDFNKTTQKDLNISPLLGIPYFLPESAYVNVNGKLYISGGILNGQPSDSFIVYDARSNELKRLKDLTVSRHSHSMFYHDNHIYVVGGNTEVCEKIDITNSNTWIRLSNLSEIRFYPLLYVHNNFLYAFFGMRNGNYLETVEKLHINNLKAKWMQFDFKGRSVMIDGVKEIINLGMIGCGIIQTRENEILLLGGKGKDGPRTSVFKFNLLNPECKKLEINIDEIYFNESYLIKLKENNLFGQFNILDSNRFYKFHFN